MQVLDKAKNRRIHRTAWYCLLHLLVDCVCALAMFGRFLREDNRYFYLLLYNFCAFALQMPMGVLLDTLIRDCGKRKRDYALMTALAGILCTLSGAVLHPVILGIGNALFHVGGGVGTIREDWQEGWQGRGLGVFVAPGALGLYLGTWMGKSGGWEAVLWGIGIVTLLLCGAETYRTGKAGKREFLVQTENRKERESFSPKYEPSAEPGCRVRGKRGDLQTEGKNCGNGQNDLTGHAKEHGKTIRAAACCMIVVILRSYVGMAVNFPWKTGVLAGILTVFAIAGGKAAGGFVAARWGMRKTAAVSLSAAACCYLLSFVMPVGLAALFLFNMTMPVTLYGMGCLMPKRPGFVFGVLTFALFLGFLPGYLGLLPAARGGSPGCAGSLLSLALLMVAGIGERCKWRFI